MARICVIRQGWFPMDPRVTREVDALLDAGHEVDIVCLRRPGEPRREQKGGLRVLRVPFVAQRRGGPLRYILQYSLFFAIASLVVTARHLRRRYDVVQTNTLPDTLVFAALVPRLTGARVMLDLHECMPEFFATKFGRPLEHPLVRVVTAAEQASIRFSDFAITCTEQMREAFVSRGADADHIGVIHNTANESVWNPERHPPRPRREGTFTLICHGSIEPRYGLDTAIRAIALLRDELPELQLRIYGEGSQLPELKELVGELGIGDRVWFSDGYVPMDELVAAVADADAGIVAMSRDEFRDLTHCNKMYDLIAMRRPVLSSWTRSVAAYFSEDALIFFESDNEHDLARRIRELHDSPELGGRAAERATEEIERLRWPVQRALYQGFIAELAARRQPSATDGAAALEPQPGPGLQ
jgi:glycosyltransferase involved in cell wall biosynthesis